MDLNFGLEERWERSLDLFNLWTGGNKVLERTFWIKFLFIDFDRKPWQNRKEFLKKEFSYVVEWKKKKAEKEGKYFCETSKLFFSLVICASGGECFPSRDGKYGGKDSR